jgi:long-chain fatty acid transport protein
MAINPKLSFGVALNVPFGLKTEYDAGWRGQLKALKSEIVSVNINPSVAYKVSDTVSIGAGVSVQKLEATLTKAANAAGTNIAELNADDIGYGFNLGFLIQATPDTRVGGSYRSSIKYDLEGTVTFSATPAGNGGVRADLKVPDSASISVFRRLNPKWELMGDATWTGWSTVQQFTAIRTTGAVGTTVDSETFNWKDTWRFGVGANYKMSDQTKIRFGVALDETPTNDVDRTPRLPDQDRTWLAFGVQYKPSKTSILDVGYAHEFIKDATVNNTVAGAGTLSGTFKNKADIFSIQYSQSF